MLKRFLKGTLLLTLANLIQRLGTVVLTLLISRWLGAAELGIYASAIAYYGLLTLHVHSVPRAIWCVKSRSSRSRPIAI